MIVDKIYSYLNGEGVTIDEALRYEVEKLAGVSFKRQFMTEEKDSAPGVLRLSAAGKCARQLAYGYHGLEKKGKEIDGRAKMIFFQGDLTENMLLSIAKLAGCNLVGTGLNQGRVKLLVGEKEIEGHPDGLLLAVGEIFLVEFKSMSSYSFERFEKGYIDDSYKAQINAYMHALGVSRCVFVGFNKDSGVLHEMVIVKDQDIVDFVIKNLESVLVSTPEKLPDPAYKVDEKGVYPWQCLYCSWFAICRPNAEKVLVGKSYKLKEKIVEESALQNKAKV